MKTYTSPSFWYGMEYPPTWTFEESSEGTSFYREHDGEGALQISAFETPGLEPAKKLLAEYIKHENLDADIITESGPDGGELATATREDGRQRTSIWFARKRNLVLFITYISEARSQSEEQEVVSMLKTLRLDPPDVVRKK